MYLKLWQLFGYDATDILSEGFFFSYGDFKAIGADLKLLIWSQQIKSEKFLRRAQFDQFWDERTGQKHWSMWTIFLVLFLVYNLNLIWQTAKRTFHKIKRFTFLPKKSVLVYLHCNQWWRMQSKHSLSAISSGRLVDAYQAVHGCGMSAHVFVHFFQFFAHIDVFVQCTLQLTVLEADRVKASKDVFGGNVQTYWKFPRIHLELRCLLWNWKVVSWNVPFWAQLLLETAGNISQIKAQRRLNDTEWRTILIYMNMQRKVSISKQVNCTGQCKRPIEALNRNWVNVGYNSILLMYTYTFDWIFACWA